MTKGEQIEKLTAIVQRALTKDFGKLTPSWVYDLGVKGIAKALVEEENVVVLPCNIGDKFWWIYTSPIGEKKVQQEEVYSISVMKDGRFLLRTFDCCSWELHEVYFSKEEAEQALKRMVDKC